MPPQSVHVTAAEISRLAGVTRATVSNWRRRHADFPAPVGGTPSSPAYDLDAVRAWLGARNQLPTTSPQDELRSCLRRLPSSARNGRLLRLLIATLPTRGPRPARLLDLPDEQLLREADDIVRRTSSPAPGVRGLPADPADDRPADPAVIRALLRCVEEDGAEAALDVLAELTPPTSGTYQTPGWLADLMAGLLQRPGGEYPVTVLDPACGGGTLLAAAALRGAERLFGQDLLPEQALQTAARLQVRVPAAEGEIRARDSIRHDAFPGLLADGVLCNPPYGDRDWGQDDVAVDPRWAFGLPPKTESELVWLQHCLAHLADGGTAVLLLPPGVAERASGRRIRAEMIRNGVLRAVIALPAGAAVPLHVGLHLWILHRSRDDMSSPPPVLFVDATTVATAPVDARLPEMAKNLDAAPGPGECAPEPEGTPAWTADTDASRGSAPDWYPIAEAVQEIWQGFLGDPEGFTARLVAARAVPVLELLDDAVDLSPSRRTQPVLPAATPSQHAEAANTIAHHLTEVAQEVSRLAQAGPWREYPETQTQAQPWRTATVEDLIRGGALTLLRGTGTQRRSDATAAPEQGSPPDGVVRSRDGDIVLPDVMPQSPSQHGPLLAHVVTSEENDRPVRTGWYVLRSTQDRFDPWFLAGFLSAAPNVRGATSGTTLVRLDVKRLRIPLLPFEEQHRYGDAFRHLDRLRRAAEMAAELADQTARVAVAGLTSGALSPP
jgi:SAM-dependent methyltransferase